MDRGSRGAPGDYRAGSKRPRDEEDYPPRRGVPGTPLKRSRTDTAADDPRGRPSRENDRPDSRPTRYDSRPHHNSQGGGPPQSDRANGDSSRQHHGPGPRRNVNTATGPKTERESVRQEHKEPKARVSSEHSTAAVTQTGDLLDVKGTTNGEHMDLDDAGWDIDPELIKRVMGFNEFNTTHDKKVPGNDRNYLVDKTQASQYRQYMNRDGGFNRPLSPTRGKNFAKPADLSNVEG